MAKVELNMPFAALISRCRVVELIDDLVGQLALERSILDGVFLSPFLLELVLALVDFLLG